MHRAEWRDFHEPSNSRRRTCGGSAPPVFMRGGDAGAQRHVPLVPGSRGLATRDRTVEPSSRSTLDTRRIRESSALRSDGATASDRQGSWELMLTVLILLVLAVFALVLILLAVVVVAIRQEPRDAEMSNMAPSAIAVMVRRLLGVYLRRPTPPPDNTYWREERLPDVPPGTAQSRPPGGRR